LDAAGQQRMILELNLDLAKANPQSKRGNFVSRDGRRLELQDLVIPDLNAFKGLPATFINLNGCKGVTDISPLADMPLEELHMANVQVRDLTLLKNMPLRKLNIEGNGLIIDLAFLGKAKLNWLVANRCSQLKDVSVLVGMPIESLHLEGTLLDAAPLLNGAPLQEASFRSCPKLKSLAGLAKTHIQRLWIDNTPGLKSLKELKGAPLTELSIGGTCAIPLEDLAGMPLQRLTLDSRADLRSCKGLEGLPLNWLNLNSCSQLGDLSALKGKALQEIHLHRTAVQSLDALAGMPLTEINLSVTRIADLTPIAQCPLRLIHMQDMQLLKSLAPLASMPVNEVRLGSTRTRDMAVLNGIATLNRICPVPPAQPGQDARLTTCPWRAAQALGVSPARSGVGRWALARRRQSIRVGVTAAR
jgi:hypothetical protein